MCNMKNDLSHIMFFKKQNENQECIHWTEQMGLFYKMNNGSDILHPKLLYVFLCLWESTCKRPCYCIFVVLESFLVQDQVLKINISVSLISNNHLNLN